MKKTLLALLCVIVLFPSVSLVAYAAPLLAPSEQIEIGAGYTEKESGDEINGPQYRYKTENIIKTNNGLIEVPIPKILKGQPTKGTYVGRNDALHYAKTGGGSVSVGVSYQLPPPFGWATFTVSGETGIFRNSDYVQNGGSVSLENGQTPGYYLVKMTKWVQIRPYAVYKQRVGVSNASWQLDHTGYVVTDPCYRVRAELVKP